MVLLHVTRLLRTSKSANSGFRVMHKANLMSRSTRGCPLELMKPFPYEEKKFTYFDSFFDNTMVRVSQENAKIIVIEGPIGVGKTAFAKALAEEYDMRHYPEVNMEQHYVLPSGYDIRQHDPDMPFVLKSYDHRDFCCNPTDPRATIFQINMMYYRFQQYLDAMTHILNTGQGAVLERSYYSDRVFMNAMYDNKYVKKEAFDLYKKLRLLTSTFLLAPHLIIYLDIPIPVVQERIRTRNYSYEQNSPALTPEFLKSMEHNYKNVYLKQAVKFSELLMYDWTDGGDVELITEDIEKLDFDISRKDRRFIQWQLTRWKLYELRQKFTNDRNCFNSLFSFNFFDVPGCEVETSEVIDGYKLLAERIPECQYDIGYNTKMGDKFYKILFKTSIDKHRERRRHLLWPGYKYAT